MRVLFRGDGETLRSSFSFSTSGLIHAILLAVVAFGRGAAPERPKSLYDEMIRGREKRIVWYRLPDRLPDAIPASAARATNRPLRATKKAQQRIVAGARDDGRPPQLVWSPLPEAPAKLEALPNVIAVEEKAARGIVRPFTPPPVRTTLAEAPVLPDAEAVALRGTAAAGPALAPLRKTFAPPPMAKSAAAAAPALPDAEAVALRGTAAAGPALAPLRKTFAPPPMAKSAAAAAPALPDAEAVALRGTAAAGPPLAPLRKTFAPPPMASSTRAAAPLAPELPAISATGPTTEVARVAIIGLDPSRATVLPAPPAPRTAGFSAGPKPEPNGAESDGSASGVVVPGVTIRDGPTRASLLAAIRPMTAPLAPAAPMPGATPSTRVKSAPDASLEGRAVYSVAIQMPNITSHSGSWLVWFAERHESRSGIMRAPSPVRKVDPKYVASAVADGVQGVVRLGAVITKDGRVESIRLLRHLDDRLDHSAMESLAKWQFEAAARDGEAIDVDAVFEIPFRLAPKPQK